MTIGFRVKDVRLIDCESVWRARLKWSAGSATSASGSKALGGEKY